MLNNVPKCAESINGGIKFQTVLRLTLEYTLTSMKLCVLYTSDSYRRVCQSSKHSTPPTHKKQKQRKVGERSSR